MSVTITLSDRQRTELMLLTDFAATCASFYHLYAPKEAKAYWEERRAVAQELSGLLVETPRDVEPCFFTWITRDDRGPTVPHECCKDEDGHAQHQCRCGATHD